MNADDLKNDFSLIPRSPSAVEKAESGAKRVLATMVSETLAIAQRQLTPVSSAPTQAELENWYQQGEKYYLGEGVSKNDVEAVKWFRLAAEGGNPVAQDRLAQCFSWGHGVPQDYAEAVKWCRRAAEQGLSGAQCSLGTHYSNGHGVPKNDVEAAKWTRLAAEQGDALSQKRLGEAYIRGLGVPKDDVEAYKWFKLALDPKGSGIRFAETSASRLVAPKLALLLATMSREQLREGERRYNEFRAGHKT